MNADLDPVIAALAELGAAELHALIAATHGVPRTAPGAMQIAESFGQTLVLSFSSFERNPKLDSDLFRIVTPEGADLLEDR